MTTSNDTVGSGGLQKTPVQKAGARNHPVRASNMVEDVPALWFATLMFLEGTPLPGKSGLSLTSSVLATVDAVEKGFIIRCGWVDEESSAPTLGEAQQEFLASLEDRYLWLIGHENELPDRERTLLKRMREVIGKRPSVEST